MAIRTDGPGRLVIVVEAVDFFAAGVDELDLFASLPEGPLKTSVGRKPVSLLEPVQVAANHPEALGLDLGARRKFEVDPFGEFPAAEIDRLVARIENLHVLELGDVVARMIKDLVDDDGGAEWSRKIYDRADQKHYSQLSYIHSVRGCIEAPSLSLRNSIDDLFPRRSDYNSPMNSPRIGVVIAQLGTPDAPTAPALRRYL